MKYLLELEGRPEATKYKCEHCGRKHVRSTGYVMKDGEAFAAYHAYLHGRGGDTENALASFTIIFADWGKSTEQLVNAVAFEATAREGESDYEFMLQDPIVSETSDMERLTRAQALSHPKVKDAWDVIDFIVIADSSVHKLLYGHGPKL